MHFFGVWIVLLLQISAATSDVKKKRFQRKYSQTQQKPSLERLLVRRRLSQNACVDDKVLQLLGDSSHPSEQYDLIIGFTIGSGANAKSRCEERGLEFCELLGSHLDSTSLRCDVEYSYIGPREIEDGSVYSCMRYIYGVRTGDQETLERLASVAESDEVLVVSELDRTIRSNSCVQQSSAPWGLAFLDRHSPDTSGTSTFHYNSLDGVGTVAYVIDTGLDPDHLEFEGRILGGYNFVQRNSVNVDYDGHGTHVAGTILGSTYGVAKQAQVYALNVFDNSEFSSSQYVISAMQFAAERASENNEKAVMNLSLGGPGNSAEDSALTAAIATGITAVVASGNSFSDACNDTPARVERAITVGATDSNGRWASFSSYGICVDIAAPGVGIQSARAGTTTGSTSLSGTSMSAPHVAGVVLQIMSRYDTSDPETIENYLISQSQQDTIPNIPSNTVNLVLQSPCVASEGPVNECEYHPDICRNGGTCVDEEEGFRCDCPPGAEGDFCQTYNECLDSPCQNGGQCNDLADGFECQCQPGYSGQFCENFSSTPNGCTCVEQTHPSWGAIGDYCNTWGGQTDPFCYVTGSCQGIQNSQALSGAQWVPCISGVDDGIDQCLQNPCDNGGTCTDLPEGFSCECPLGYSGATCTTYTFPPAGCTCTQETHPTWGQVENYCADWGSLMQPFCYVDREDTSCSEQSPSQSVSGAFWVNCQQEERTGDPSITRSPTKDPTFEPTSVCSDRPCENGATCSVIDDGNFECICLPGYSGVTCSTSVCSSQPCENGATCSVTAGGDFECSCAPEFSGETCSDAPCSSQPCENGATCLVLAEGGFECDCPPGYSGDTCSVEPVPACSNSPCDNGSTCVDLANGDFQCVCAPRYDGETCTTYWYAPNGCKCQSETHPRYGESGAYCDGHFGFEPFCYVEAVCEGSSPSGSIAGANWIDCLSEQRSGDDPYAPVVTKEPTAEPTRIVTDEPTKEPTKHPTQEPSIPLLNECLDSPCDNGATCVDLEVGFECQCYPGYTGELCTTFWGLPDPARCRCEEENHPTWGDAGNYCDRWGGHDHPWCYVNSDCPDGTASGSIAGAFWDNCVSEERTGDDPVNPPVYTVSPTLNPTLDPTPDPDAPVEAQVYICRYYTPSWEWQCCWKDEGSHSRGDLSVSGCPWRGQIRYIRVPPGTVATAYSRNGYRGNQLVLEAGEHSVLTRQVKSLQVEAV